MKIKRLVAVFMAVIMAFSCMAISASAAEIQPYNNHDDIFFYAADVARGWQSGTEDKTDASGTYVSFEGTTCDYAKFTVLGGDKVNYTSPDAYIYQGTQRLISQYVYEKGQRKCILKISRAGYDGTATGFWSPDSVGDYPYAN